VGNTAAGFVAMSPAMPRLPTVEAARLLLLSAEKPGWPGVCGDDPVIIFARRAVILNDSLVDSEKFGTQKGLIYYGIQRQSMGGAANREAFLFHWKGI